MNIYRETTKKLYSFLTIDTTLSASDPLKIYFLLVKMTVTDQLKIIHNKSKANQAQIISRQISS